MVKLLIDRGAPLEKNVFGGTVLSSTLWLRTTSGPRIASRDYPAVIDGPSAAEQDRSLPGEKRLDEVASRRLHGEGRTKASHRLATGASSGMDVEGQLRKAARRSGSRFPY